MMLIKHTLILVLTIVISTLSAGNAFAQDANEQFEIGTITAVKELGGSIVSSQQQQSIQIELKNKEQTVIQIEHTIINNRADLQFAVGDTVIIEKSITPNGDVLYFIRDTYRFPALLWLVVGFFILTFFIGGITGLRSVLGLFSSIAIVLLVIVPMLLSGIHPLLVSILGSALTAAVSIYIAHGVNRRTTTALLSTVLTLIIAILLAILCVYVAKLFGLGTEESIFLQASPFSKVNMQGLLLAGIIIGTLGVLDDITTAQTAAIDELSKANHSLSAKQLYKAGSSIGQEHIASLINTLALAYFGSSLPLFLLLITDASAPWWVTINSEFLSEEIVRTLVGSAALLFAVPISTWIAAVAFAHGNHTNVKGGHCH